MNCLFDPMGCITGALWQWVASIPWWAWAALGLAIVGIVWKVAGWPGLIGLAAATGYVLGRRSKDDDLYVHEDPKPVRRSSQKPPPGKVTRTIFDMLGKR